MAALRSKNFTTLAYPESISRYDLIDFLDSLHISYLVSPIHNLDITGDGLLKKSHWHVVLIFDSLKSVSQVRGLLDSRLVGCEIVNSLESYARYLTHMDNPDKAQYSQLDVVAHGVNYNELVNRKEDKYAAFERIVDYIVDNNVTSFAKLLFYARKNDQAMFRSLVDNSYTAREFIKSYSSDLSGCFADKKLDVLPETSGKEV